LKLDFSPLLPEFRRPQVDLKNAEANDFRGVGSGVHWDWSIIGASISLDETEVKAVLQAPVTPYESAIFQVT